MGSEIMGSEESAEIMGSEESAGVNLVTRLTGGRVTGYFLELLSEFIRI